MGEHDVRNESTVSGRPGPAGSLEVPVLVSRLLALLDSAARFTERLPAEALDASVPGQERTQRDLAYHLPQVVVAFLDAALGGRISREHFDRRPPDHLQTAADVARLTRSVSQALAVWWGANQARLPATVDTYYGVQPLHAVVERTTWHVAQHARQLEQLLALRGIAPQPPLAAVLLDGLPLPANVWDDEVMPA
jgi:hypothetical protein